MSLSTIHWALASDDELEAILTDQGFDGTWSITTRLTVMALKAQGQPLYLNYLWAATPQNFRCPVCQRGKPELMESSNGKVIAVLSLDHDHMVDYINELARELGIHTDLKPLYDHYMSFTPAIICNSCNAIDSLAKTKLRGIDATFTFPPPCKSELFRPYKRSAHWVNLAKAQRLWEAHKPFHRRQKAEIPTALQDFIGAHEAFYGYKRYVDDEVKRRFMALNPGSPVDTFQQFVRRSTAHGSSSFDGASSMTSFQWPAR